MKRKRISRTAITYAESLSKRPAVASISLSAVTSLPLRESEACRSVCIGREPRKEHAGNQDSLSAQLFNAVIPILTRFYTYFFLFCCLYFLRYFSVLFRFTFFFVFSPLSLCIFIFCSFCLFSRLFDSHCRENIIHYVENRIEHYMAKARKRVLIYKFFHKDKTFLEHHGKKHTAYIPH